MNPKELLKKGLKELGLSYSKEVINAFLTFLSELKKWNRAYSLTALKTDEDIILKHFIDSLLYLKAIPANSLKIADVGTGAGFPGVPIKIIRPEIDLTLIESSRKKAVFLRHIVRVLQLNKVNVLDKRLETLGELYERTYDVIVSRATFKIKDFLKKACPFVKEDGRLVLSKGPRVYEEIKELKNKDVIKEVLKLPLSIKPDTILFKAERNLVTLGCEKISLPDNDNINRLK